jgi:hypothetical protein
MTEIRMTCADIVALVTDYLEGAVDEATAWAVERTWPCAPAA